MASSSPPPPNSRLPPPSPCPDPHARHQTPLLSAPFPPPSPPPLALSFSSQILVLVVWFSNRWLPSKICQCFFLPPEVRRHFPPWHSKAIDSVARAYWDLTFLASLRAHELAWNTPCSEVRSHMSPPRPSPYNRRHHFPVLLYLFRILSLSSTINNVLKS